ncbi:transcriptional regulator, IclR family [Nakamurella panacisegetis]|uniref:Transcriptional regulator, IclR family n=1 Tax=Nakamurella panacisegetis TaxID=1090615 RepID=A0A1H0LHT3_9ACTN|nr:IclR family transcriptional regulator [Nakamurella panacisegetis]SDO67663.1 transcriptional regulator, IclR family [Nakamurella panacisegetis]
MGSARPPADDEPASSVGAVKSADRLMTLFEHLAQVGEATFSSITADLKIPNSSAYQLLRTAHRRGFVEFDEHTRTYRLGLRIWEVAQSFAGNLDLPGTAQPLMTALSEETGETVQLARLDGLENVYLAIAESSQAMKLVSTVGARLPAHTTGVGKVLLSGLADEDLAERFAGVKLERFTRNTLTSLPELLTEVHRIQKQGYGEDNEEYVVGCRCIAMPVRGGDGRPLAAMSVSIPTPRFNRTVARDVRSALNRTVVELERRLGSGLG